MAKIIMFSDIYLPTFPYLDIPLYRELCSSGVDVSYVLQEGDIRLKECEHFHYSDIAQVYGKIVHVIKKPKELVKLMNKGDLLLIRFAYKNVAGKVAETVRAAGHKILMLDPAAVDLKHRECCAQFITAKSEWMKGCVVKNINKRYNNIFVTGTIHYDAALQKSFIDRTYFMEKLGLNTKKKLAILCKASQGEIGHQFGVDDEYVQIAKLVQTKCKDYELIFKCHPIDHLSQYPCVPGVLHKNEHYNNKPSWTKLFPEGIKILPPELGCEAFRAADVILNVRSSIGMETMLFPVPLLNINSHKYLINWPKSDNNGVMKNIKLEQLEEILNSNDYYIDKQACVDHVKKYCDPFADGMAYKRIANVAMSLIK